MQPLDIGSPHGFSRFNALVVDDSSLVRTWIGAELSRSGFAHVDMAADGAEAVRRIAESRPDIVLTDFHLPSMSGQELVASIRADKTFEDLPVVVVTTEGRLAFDWAKLGFSQYLRKPFTLSRLRSVVRDLLLKGDADDEDDDDESSLPT